MDFLTIDMVKKHCRFELDDPEIDRNIKKQANLAEQRVYKLIDRNYLDIIKEWGEVPPAIIHAALMLTGEGILNGVEHSDAFKVLLRPYKKK